MRTARPVTAQDLTSHLLLSMGVDPSKAVGAHTRASQQKAKAPTPFRVVGGQATEAHAKICEDFANADRQRRWSEKTQSRPDALAWALNPDT